MQGIYILNQGKELEVPSDKSTLTLLAGHDNVEIMMQTIKKDSLVWITPDDNTDLMEFFYILNGTLILENDDEKITLQEGNYFYVSNLKSEVLLKSITNIKMLYVTTKPLFNYLNSFTCDLNELLVKVDHKDKYTNEHSRRVMQYSVKICQKMKYEHTTIDKIAVASLFHDVGKCFTPDDILNKIGKLDIDEWRYVIKHPVNSGRLLEAKFGKDIANIARMHHERLDGSGYPYGLCAKDIPIEARIIAVADSFDAMTSKRTYSDAKKYYDAVSELSLMSDLYDKNVVSVLEQLVQSGEIK
jgi:HD-GYP domain-containing protein (c-di-GMP phosphodiesterase class II)